MVISTTSNKLDGCVSEYHVTFFFGSEANAEDLSFELLDRFVTDLSSEANGSILYKSLAL